MTNQNFSTAAVPLLVPTACGNCGVEERRFLHHVRHRGIFRRLCTNCVLKLHPQSFCPTCLLVYNPSPPPSNSGLVTCLKCYSLSHNTCVGLSPPHSYTCPLCINPNSPFFSLKKGKDVGVCDDADDVSRVFDKKAAKILLTAAAIAAGSMSKAAAAARLEAERRGKEAAFTRKRAREALEHVAYIMARDNNDNKIKKKEDVLPLPSNNLNNIRGGSSSNQCRSVAVVAVPLEEQNNVVDKLDGSSEVLVALNAVHLIGQKNPNPALNNGSAMDVEANGGAMLTPTDANRRELVQNNMAAEDEKSGKLGCGNGMVNNGMVSVQDQDMGTSDARVPNGSLPKL